MRYNLERMLCEGMLKQKGDQKNFLNAICNLPRNMRNLYLHAFQSYLWNTCASLRIRRLGYKLVVGDFVVKEKNQKTEEKIEEKAEVENEDENYERLVDSDFIIVDEEMLQSGKYSIQDIYIPIIGSDFVYTEQSNCHDIYKELMSQEKIEVSDFLRLGGHFQVNGSWRMMIQVPDELDWKMVKHTT